MSLKPSSVVEYYRTKESKWGYHFLLGNIRHFGYYDLETPSISMHQAMINMQDVVIEHLKPQKEQRILDAGCGAGEPADYISRKTDTRVIGIDIVPENITKAKSSFANNKNAEFILGDYTKTTFSDNTFDSIYTMETLVHVENYETALLEFKRLLKPGGRLVMLEYSHAPLSQISEHAREMLALVNTYSAMPGFQQFDHGILEAGLNKVGYKVELVEDISDNIHPMIEKFYRLASFPYKFISMFNLQSKFINTTAGYELYKHPELFRYNIFVAVNS